MANKTYKVNEYNINNYTIEDKDFIFENVRKNKSGFPTIYPTKNLHGKKIVLSFIDARIYDKNGNLVSDKVANFNIADDEKFDSNAEDADLKIEFISALLSLDLFVKGGVYFKGKFYTSKITDAQCDYLTSEFMKNYFSLEDKEQLYKWFKRGNEDTVLRFWPTHSRSKGNSKKVAIFSAVDAVVSLAGENVKENAPKFNFNIFWGDTFDLKKKEDREKVDIIHSLLDENRVVNGFYYKGKLLPRKLSKKFKLYLEKTFIKKNFSVEDRDFLFTYISKDHKTGYPVFWPMKSRNGRKIIASVVNAAAEWFDCEKYGNFDVYEDEFFDLTKEEFQTKLQIMQNMYTGSRLVTGALYFDGMLIPGDMNRVEVDRRKGKVEKALKIHIGNTEDFLKMSKDFSIEDKEKILRLVSLYDKFYPESDIEVPNRDKEFDKNGSIILKVVDVNLVDEKGDYVFDQPISFEVNKGDKVEGKDKVDLFKYLLNPSAKVRGGVFFNGVNIARRLNGKRREEFASFTQEVLSSEDLKVVEEFKSVSFYRFQEDRKTHLPLCWPTKDRHGKEVLLSVVDGAVHFKNGRRIVKAANDMNFDIYVGETFGLVGESGSGKTTISRAILGINKLALGGIYFKGKLISSGLTREESKKTKKNIQMIFQDPAASLNERANIDYIVSEGLYNFKLFKTKEERLEKISNIMREVGLLPEHLSRYPHEFSGGQRQRIGIARALVIEPELVLADEPISALDVSIRAQILNLLKKMQEEQSLTYLFIAHDLSIIRYISDRIAVMHNGYVVELGPAEEIYSNPLHPYTRSLLTAIPQPDPISKNDRIRVPYNQGDIVYKECRWKDFGSGHFVLVNDMLDKEITKRVNKK